MGKELLRFDDAPKKIKNIKFGIASSSEIGELAEVEVCNRELYSVTNREPVPHGCLDRKLGISDKSSTCETCGGKLAECSGHFGEIKLVLPVWHIGFFKAALQVLQDICKTCGEVLLTREQRETFLRRLRAPRLDSLQRAGIIKSIHETCRKVANCHACNALNGTVKKIGVLKVVHERYRSTKKGQADGDGFKRGFAAAISSNPEIKTHLGKAHDDINPLRVRELFSRITAEDCELLGLDAEYGHPRDFIWSSIPVPPSCIRPSVAMTMEGGSNEDDLTVKLSEIVYTNSIIKEALDKGVMPMMLVEDWDFLQLQCAMYINSELPGVPLALQTPGKPIRGLCQRLKGKMGRFRGNLSGKRVDFSSRTVISPDPNLRINQIAVPVYVAKTLTYPQVVTKFNIESMRAAVINGPDQHPGANYVQSGDAGGLKRFLKFGDRKRIAKDLRVGDIVERHLRDGDVVLFNRQPSLHKLSIMAHFAVVKPWRTFRFNECACTPYNADFDGDEMNMHLPQTEEARAEAIELMGVQHNLVTPRNGQPLIAATQDFITASHLISNRDVFMDRAEFAQTCCMMCDANEKIDLPHPTILKPHALWTGKQTINVLMKPNASYDVKVNLELKGRTFTKPAAGLPFEMCPNDGFLVVRNSEIMCGTLDKSSVGGDNKGSIFYVLMRDYGSEYAVTCMTRLAKLCARYLGNRGFSIGINDVQPDVRLRQEKEIVVKKGYEACDNVIADFQAGRLQNQPGCTAEQTVEATISGILSRIRDDVGQICLQELSRHNAPLIMQWCGSKGSKINVSQMVACVGQQIISGSRIPDGFDDRSLPHFEKRSKIPAAKGFVQNSFYSGLTPTEFFFHAVSGREGLVDTAVKTAETGYMQRRLMKALEDLSTHYDMSVRNSIGGVVQFCYGDDGLDPASMEGDGCPVNFSRNLMHAKAINQITPEDTMEASLTPAEVSQLTEDSLAGPMFKDCSVGFIDSVRDFMAKSVIDPLQKNWSSDSTCLEPVRLTARQLSTFFRLCADKYLKARMEPGTAVGALGAQSIGEPGTQMTLKTFHFAGVASMNVTLGVPRIKEIINASKAISTPIITAKLVAANSVPAARIAKGRIEKTLLGEIAEYIEEVYQASTCYLSLKLDMNAIRALQLEIDVDAVEMAITRAPKLKLTSQQIRVQHPDRLQIHLGVKKTSSSAAEDESPYYRLQTLKRLLPHVVVKGYPTVNRAVINDLGNGQYNLLVEGYGLRQVMTTDGIVGTACTSNHIMEVESVLGIEAARSTIAGEIQYTMAKHGMTIDNRHVALLADIMTCRGEVLGITRFGIAKMKDSVLMLASFEKTADHLFDAARFSKQDDIDGVSECIIMGSPMPVGTGLFKVLQKVERPAALQAKGLLFDQAKFHPKWQAA